MRWEYDGAGRYRNVGGDVLASDELTTNLKEQSQLAELLVVKRMQNHSAIRCFAGVDEAVLSTCRLITTLDEQGNPEVVGATFKIAVHQTVADNVHFGGLAAPVNIVTGELGRS